LTATTGIGPSSVHETRTLVAIDHARFTAVFIPLA